MKKETSIICQDCKYYQPVLVSHSTCGHKAALVKYHDRVNLHGWQRSCAAMRKDKFFGLRSGVCGGSGKLFKSKEIL